MVVKRNVFAHSSSYLQMQQIDCACVFLLNTRMKLDMINSTVHLQNTIV